MRLIEKLEIHDTLNPKLWKNDKLKPEVTEAIIAIVSEFQDNLEIPLEIVDIHIVGSNASYNWTDNSDLDIHIISNFEFLDCAKEVAQALYNSERSSFNKNYDITIKGINAEIYVEDINSSVASNGIYSIFENEWIKHPEKLEGITIFDTEKEVSEWLNRIKLAIESNDSEIIKGIINQLYLMRKNSIAIEGEYGKGNQVFKDIRNTGKLDELKDLVKEFKSKELSLESFNDLSIQEMLERV